jgi:CRP-like cAMP-binding protein
MVKSMWDNIFNAPKVDTEISAALTNNLVFQNLSYLEMNLVKKLVHKRTYRPGEVIFRQGEIGVGMYIIVNGNVNISVENQVDLKSDQQETLITQLKAGDFFGETALVEASSRRPATATAANDVTLLGFFKPDLSEILDRNPRLGALLLSRIADILSRRLKETSLRLKETQNKLQTSGGVNVSN